jgi:NAD(P)-dependent dehydrogenase (short-subunit alcohol dehydrogenase family)
LSPAASGRCFPSSASTADEVASAVAYLASSESAYVVGTELMIDGGMSEI